MSTPNDSTKSPIRLVSRADAIAIVNRGGDYVTHVFRGSNPNFTFTLCGRALRGGVNEHKGDYPTCKRCRAAIAKAEGK
jgi:hypothetical protein